MLARSPASSAFDALPADAGESTRQYLAVSLLRLALDIRSLLSGLPDTTARSAAAAHTIDVALRELYNPAQVDVLCPIRRCAAT